MKSNAKSLRVKKRKHSNSVKSNSHHRKGARLNNSPAGIVELIVCVGGIYASFLLWALLQERITTKLYDTERFTFPILLLTIQSCLAAILGFAYLIFMTPQSRGKSTSRNWLNIPPIFPSSRIVVPLFFISLASSLAAPFGYASLKYIDYITFILAKSCKLLPVMAVHVGLFRRKYPAWKYCVVGLVTLGVALFTVYHPGTAAKAARNSKMRSSSEFNSGILSQLSSVIGISPASVWGLSLLAINLFFDGITNSTQDHLFKANPDYSAPQMMVSQNTISSLINLGYLVLLPRLARSFIGHYFNIKLDNGAGELRDGLAFLYRHHEAYWDVLGFALCGAVGQVFIFRTLSRFSSLLLVTVTVTRKMLTMILSVLLFGHVIQPKQWLGVGLVFGGIGIEAVIQRYEKMKISAKHLPVKSR